MSRRSSDDLTPKFLAELIDEGELESPPLSTWLDVLVDGVTSSDGARSTSSFASPERRQALLAAATTGAMRFAPFLEDLAHFFDLSVGAVRTLLSQAERDDQWGPGFVDGMRLFHFEGGPRFAAADCGLVRVPAGSPFPAHRHRGDERVFVLAGSFVDDQGRHFGPGDRCDMPSDSRHQMIIGSDEDLVFAVTLFDGLDFGGS